MNTDINSPLSIAIMAMIFIEFWGITTLGVFKYAAKFFNVSSPIAFFVGILEFIGCKDVTIRDVTVRYSDSWTLDLERCENVVIDGVSILNSYYRVNADGIDPVSCKSVRISNCHIVAGDDCIVCKTREGYPCEDIVVTNCVLESIATAVKIGTESPSDFRNIL
jgi:polygalacturonase